MQNERNVDEPPNIPVLTKVKAKSIFPYPLYPYLLPSAVSISIFKVNLFFDKLTQNLYNIHYTILSHPINTPFLPKRPHPVIISFSCLVFDSLNLTKAAC